MIIDQTDRMLLAALRADGRASTTALAATLGLARATVHARVERLREAGVIKRFTIEIGVSAEDDKVRAVMLIALKGAMSRAVIRQLRKMPEIATLHSTNGGWDLVANIETASLTRFDQVLREVREIPGVVNSETCLLLSEA